MSDPATPDELVRLFIEEASRRLTALPVSSTLSCTADVRHFGDSDWFEVTVAFSNNAVEGAFRFGERENAIWAEARKAGAEQTFALWEWSAVLNRIPGPWEGGDWVYEPERVRAIVDALADALRLMHDGIAGATDADHERLFAARAARSEEDAEHARVREQERDEVQAAAAFRKGDFDTTARLLRKHVAQLSPAQQRKLALAESKLSPVTHSVVRPSLAPGDPRAT